MQPFKFTTSLRALPVGLPAWLRNYRRVWLTGDISAGLVVSIMLIPQSLAYAMLAGLPPQVGLYASILPLLVYALLGSSMTLAVGPVAVLSLMTSSALHPLVAQGSSAYVQMAAQLALLSGLFMIVFSWLRLGFLAYFLSHPVISGFMSGSAIVIAIGQLKHLLGIKVIEASSPSAIAMLMQIAKALPTVHTATVMLGLGSLATLWLARFYLRAVLIRLACPEPVADILAKLAPVFVVIITTTIVVLADWESHEHVAVVGVLPEGLPGLGLALPGLFELENLWQPALLMALVGFVESVSVAQAMAMKRQQRIQPDRELKALGAANLASALAGGYPVTGGFSRSVVNVSAGAQTPLASLISAGLITLVATSMTAVFYHLPLAVLAATIMAAVLPVVDIRTFLDAWRYDRADAISLLATALGVVLFGVETGILLGVALSLAAIVWRSSTPHMAVLGRVPGTEHFRNVARHRVETLPGLLIVRIDENLIFANAALIEERIMALLARAEDKQVHRLLLVCSAINQIDATALSMLTAFELRLEEQGIQLELAEVKGPVMDRLQHTPLGQRLAGRIFRSTHDAFMFQ